MKQVSWLVWLLVAVLVLTGLAYYLGWFSFPNSTDQGTNPIDTEEPEPQQPTEQNFPIKVTKPTSGELVTSPLEITGEARGIWYFEATFPVFLVNWDGLIIAEGYATADGDWMTEDFVPFKATLEFEKPQYGDTGALILKKDNPSGLPQNDATLEIPIGFD